MKETLKIVWKYLSEYKKDVIWIGIMYIIVAALEITIPYIFGNLVNSVLKDATENKEMNNALIWQSLLIIVLIIITIVWLKRHLDFRRTRTAGRCEKDMALKINRHIIRLPKSFHDNKKNGAILETVSMARWNINTIINQTIFSTIPQIITIAIILAASLFINYILTITIFAIILAMAYASQLKSSEFIKIEEKYMDARKAAAVLTEDCNRNIDTIKTFSIENEIDKKYEQKYDAISDALENGLELAVNVNAVQMLIFYMGMPIIIIVSAYLMAQKLITPGQIVTVIVFGGLILNPFRNLIESYYTTKKGIVSIKESNRLLSEEKMENFEKGMMPDKKIKGGIELKNVYFTYPKSEKPVFAGLNLKISAGEKVAIIGPNGGGKTTLLKLLQRFHDPLQGEIFIDGINIQEMNLSFERKCFAVVPQKVEFFNNSILYNLRIVNPDATDEDIMIAVKLAQMGFVCDYMNGLNHIINEQEKNLSAGQTQRIAIARAIPNNAPIIVLDEPTSAQDKCSEEEIAKLLNGPFKEKTVIIISHRSKPLEFVDRVFELKNGQIAEVSNLKT